MHLAGPRTLRLHKPNVVAEWAVKNGLQGPSSLSGKRAEGLYGSWPRGDSIGALHRLHSFARHRSNNDRIGGSSRVERPQVRENLRIGTVLEESAFR